MVAGLAFLAPPLPGPLQELQRVSSLRLLDRHGQLLREQLSSAAGVSRWVPLTEMAPSLVQATVASEDKRFFFHPGVDPIACARAAWINWRRGRIVEGGSTLTQQLVRNLMGERSQGLSGKLQEAYWAVRLELRMSKRQILETYLNRVAYGHQCYGAEAASQTYFGKPAGQLSEAQSAFLAVLPRAPESFSPYQDLADIQVFQQQLLRRIGAPERSIQEPVALRPLGGSFEAGHFCDYMLSLPLQAGAEVVNTTLDLNLQHDLEQIVNTQVRHLGSRGVDSAAVVVLDVATGEILAMVGSAGYQDANIGQFNASLAGRQPGSTLKPFTYSLALERDLTASSLLPDLDLYPQDVEHGFLPRNYDEKYHGPVRLRTALACSYNVPVVRVLERLGVETLLHRLQGVGFDRLKEAPGHYGLGLTLGDGDVTLLQLANAYRVLARGGKFSATRADQAAPQAPDEAVIDPRVAYLLTDILKDEQARAPAFGLVSPLSLPFDCASKTGTSKGFRDNWTVGYTPLYVVAVWVGQSQGRAMNNVSGITGAGPVFRDCMLALEKRSGGSPRFTPPLGLIKKDICAVSGDLPGLYCHEVIQELYLKERPPAQVCDVHRKDGLAFPPLYHDWMLGQRMRLPAQEKSQQGDVRISFPDQGAVFRIDPILRQKFQEVRFRAVVPEQTTRVRWTVDNDIKELTGPFALWVPLRRGEHRAHIDAFDGQGHELGSSRDLRFYVR